MPRKKILIPLTVIAIALWTTVVVLWIVLDSTDDQNETGMIQIQPESITVRFLDDAGDQKDETGEQIWSKVFIGEERVVSYEFTNLNPVSVIIEIHPNLSEEVLGPWLTYRFGDLEGSEVDLTGVAMHLMLGPDSTTQMDLILGAKKGAPTWELYSLPPMDLIYTGCTELEDCPWG